MDGPKPYDFEPVFTVEEMRERERTGQRDVHSDESEDAPSEGLGEGLPVADRRDDVNWCQCRNCIVMPTLRECKCCVEVAGVRRVMAGIEEQCVLDHPDFPVVCLHKAVLRATSIMRNDVRGHVIDVPQELDHKSYRYSGYRMFTYWVHGRLGKGVRKVVPACVVAKIRETFPEPNGVYVGFRTTDEGEELEVDETEAI